MHTLNLLRLSDKYHVYTFEYLYTHMAYYYTIQMTRRTGVVANG